MQIKNIKSLEELHMVKTQIQKENLFIERTMVLTTQDFGKALNNKFIKKVAIPTSVAGIIAMLIKQLSNSGQAQKYFAKSPSPTLEEVLIKETVVSLLPILLQRISNINK